MELTTEEIVAVTILGFFYVILLGRYALRFLKWCNREKKTTATDLEAQNGTGTTDNTAIKEQLSVFLREEATDIEAQIKITPTPPTTKGSSSRSDAQPSSSSSIQKPKSSKSAMKNSSLPLEQSPKGKGKGIETQNETTTRTTKEPSSPMDHSLSSSKSLLWSPPLREAAEIETQNRIITSTANKSSSPSKQLSSSDVVQIPKSCAIRT